MEYDSKKSKTIKIDEHNCPYCGSSNLKKYLYGEVAHDYDKEKYVLGGCEITGDDPIYKCSDCGKDIYVEKKNVIDSINEKLRELGVDDDIINSPNTNKQSIRDKIQDSFDKNRNNITIEYSTNEVSYLISLTKFNSYHAGIKDTLATIKLKKSERNNMYKIDDIQSLNIEDYDKYYNKLMEITNNWIYEFDNNKLVEDKDVFNWSLKIKNEDNNIAFSDEKVPSNMNELKNIILELEELYKIQFEKTRKESNIE